MGMFIFPPLLRMFSGHVGAKLELLRLAVIKQEQIYKTLDAYLQYILTLDYSGMTATFHMEKMQTCLMDVNRGMVPVHAQGTI